MAISRTQAVIISDLVTLLVEKGKYRSVDEARLDFIDFFGPKGQQSFIESPKFTVRDLTPAQADHLISLYRHMLKMRNFSAMWFCRERKMSFPISCVSGLTPTRKTGKL
jgi:hypothetical protein